MSQNDLRPLQRCGAVDVWLMSLSGLTHNARAFLEQHLSEDELARARRYIVAHARDQFVAARALLRTQLSRYTNAPASSWRFESNRFGRPFISAPLDHRHLRFNLSHTRGLIACAFSFEHEIGVDVEDVTRELDVAGLAKSCFAAPENEALSRMAPEALRARFFAYWTLKESYIKARGMGLSLPLDAFWFELDGPPRLHCDARCEDSPDRWQFFLEQPTARHRLALAVASRPQAVLDIRLRWLSPDLDPVSAPEDVTAAHTNAGQLR